MKNCRDWAFSHSGLETGHCRKEIYGTCLSKESMPFVKSKPALPTRSLRSLRAAARSTSSLWLHHACKRKSCGIVENQLLDAFSLRGLEAGLPAFQLPIFGKCDALPKGDLFDLLVSGIYSRHSFWDFQASTPYQKTVRSTSSAWWLHHAHPFVAASEKSTCLMQRSRGFWSRSCGFSRKCDNALISSPMWLLQTKRLASVVWKRGCQPFSCPCSQNVTHCRKEICSTCLSKESMPFVKSKPTLPTRSLRSLRAAARSTSSLWLHHACKRKSCGIQALASRLLIVIMRLLQVNEELSRISF